MKFSYYNDTGREVGIHTATVEHGVSFEGSGVIKHGEIKVFTLPEGTYPWIKMWEYGGRSGLQILVTAEKEDSE